MEIDFTQCLADAFSQIIRDWLKHEEMAQVLIRNSVNPPNVCATHDFCDANMAMTEAFANVAGRNPNLATESDAADWNAAWVRAKNAGFPRKMILVENVEGELVYAFTIKGMSIHNPRRSEFDGFDVDPVEYYGLRPEETAALEQANARRRAEYSTDTLAGRAPEALKDSVKMIRGSAKNLAGLRKLYPDFRVWSTFCDCLALRLDCDPAGYVLITDSERLQIPPDEATDVYVTLYAANGDLVEDKRTISIKETETWIDEALSRASDPTNIADYFVKKMGAGHLDDSLRDLPMHSDCGQDCVKVIDAAVAVLEHVRTAFGDSQTGRPPGRDEENLLIDITRRVIGVYWRG